MKKDVFVETYSVTCLREAVSLAMDAGEGCPAMAMCYGEPGTGKTRAARSLYAEHGGVYVRALEGVSQNAFLQQICFELSGQRPHGSARCKNALLDQLRAEPRPIYADEADRLTNARLEDLRDLHDLTGAPVVLIGEMGLPTRVAALSRLNDRIPSALRVQFGEITARDVMLYALEAAGLKLSPEAAALVHKETKGNFRRVYGAMLSLEAAAKVAGCGEMNADMARSALAPVKGKGGR